MSLTTSLTNFGLRLRLHHCVAVVLVSGGLMNQVSHAQVSEFAQSEIRDVEVAVAQSQDSRIDLIDLARSWGLTTSEWERYQSLMEGQRGTWSPNLDPITALGVEARTEQERMRYARMLVEMEKQRVERELAFQQAYDQAWQELYPTLMPVNTFYTHESSRISNQLSALDAKVAHSPMERISIVITPDCEVCDAMVQRLISMRTNLDIYFMNAESDSVIRQWAVSMGLPVERVQSRNITLNHYAGPDVAAGDLPLVIEQ